MGVKERFEERKKQLENSATDAKNSPAPATSTRYEGVAERYAKRQRSQEENSHESGESSPNSGGSAGQGTPTTARNNELDEAKKRVESSIIERLQLANTYDPGRVFDDGYDLFDGSRWALEAVTDFLFENDSKDRREVLQGAGDRYYKAATQAKSELDNLAPRVAEINSMAENLKSMQESYAANPSKDLERQYEQEYQKYINAVNEYETLYKPHSDAIDEYNAFFDMFGEELGTPRKANLIDATIGSLKRGYVQSRLGEEWYDKMQGNENEADRYDQIMAGDDYQFEAGGLLKPISGAAELFGQQVRQWTNPRSLAMGGTGATAAAIAGQLGPQVLVPEEIITVPGAFMGGVAAGGALQNFEIEAGHAYKEMLDLGVSEETARAIATVVGGGNAALEALQIDELVKGAKVVAGKPAREGAFNIIMDVLKKRAPNLANQVVQEVAQEGVTMGGAALGSYIDKGELPYSGGEVVSRLWDTALSSTLSFGLMDAPGAAMNVSSQVSQNKQLGKIGNDYRNSVIDLIDTGLTLPPNSEAHKLAQEFKDRTAAGEEITDAEIGRLAVENAKAIKTEEDLGWGDPQSEEQQTADPIMDAAREAVGAEPVSGNAVQGTQEVSRENDTQPVQSENAVEAARNAARTMTMERWTGYGEHGTKTFTDLVEEMNADPMKVRKSFQAAYEAGLANVPRSKINLLDTVQATAYNAGQMDKIVLDAKDRKAGKVTVREDAGFVYDTLPADVTPMQVKAVDMLAKATGVRVQIAKGLKGNAEIRDDGTVLIAEDFEREVKGKKRSIVFYAAHEIGMHRLMQLAPKEGRAFINALVAEKNSNLPYGAHTDTELKHENYALQNVSLTIDKAMEEVSADAVLGLYEDEEAFFAAIDRIMNGTNEQAKKGARTFKQWLDDTVRKLKQIVAKLSGKERTQVQETLNEVTALRDLYERALTAAVNRAKTGKVANESGRTADGRGTIDHSMKEDGQNGRETTVHRGNDIRSAGALAGYTRGKGGTDGQGSGRGEVRYAALSRYEQSRVNETLINAIDKDPFLRALIKNEPIGKVSGRIFDGYVSGSKYVAELQKQVPGLTAALERAMDFVNRPKSGESNRIRTGDTSPSGQYDSKGNELTVAQAEFFKKCETRDAQGNLLVLYHGSRSEVFTEFDLYEGVWLTPDQRYAEVYAEQWHSWRDDVESADGATQDGKELERKIYADPDYRIYAMYANITTPANIGEIDVELTDNKVRSLARALNVPYAELKSIADDFMGDNTYMLTRSHEFIELAKNQKTTSGQRFDGFRATEKGRETWCAFAAENQVKLTTNKTPTAHPDIQFSLKESGEVAVSEFGTTSLVNDGEVSLSDVRNLFGRLNSNKDLAVLAEKVFATSERLGVNIRFTSQMMEPKNKLGFGQNIGFAVGDMVEYLTPAFNSGATNQAKANVLVHELIHTCSLYAMTNGYQSKSLANAAKRMERIYLEIRNDPDFAGQYGLSNVREMVAELSNEDFVKQLKAKKNLWDKIVDWFCDLFGIQHDSNAYERLSKSLDTMLANPDVKTYKEHAFATRRTGESMGKDVFGSTQYSLKENGVTMTEEEYLDLHDVQYNLKAEESHKAALKKNYSAAESVVSRDALMARYEKVLEIWKRIGGELNSKFLEDWNNKTDRVFTIFKAQHGYKYNVDLSAMCKKGVPLFEAIDTIVKKEVMRELKLDVLGKAEKEILYDILKNHNFEIPCAICYVEQARQREGVIIDAFINGSTEDGKSKLGWNTVLDDIEAEMKANGVEYKFQNVSRSIATEKYTPADIAMDENTLAAFHAAVQKLANKEIRRYNKEKGKSRRLLKEVTPEGVKACFGGTLPSNLKIFKTLLTEPSSRFRIGKDLLYSSMTTTNLASLHNGLYGLFNAQGGVSGYKTKQSTTVYWGELLGKRWRPDIVRREGGIRQQSNSDFQMYTFLDKAQMYIDHTAKGFYVQEYTKVLAELKLFGLSRAKMNASLIPKVVEYKNADGSVDVERTMLTAGLDEYGNPIYDDIEGINHAEAFMLLEDPDYSRSLCGICIGYSDKHIEKLLDEPRVQMIIGFHDKTNDPDKRYRGARYAKNYNGLNEAVEDNGAGKTKHIGFNPYLQKAEKLFTRNESTKRFEGTATFRGKQYVANDIPRLAADMYLADCAKKGYRPAYNDFTWHPNYYKLLSDIGLYDSLGQYAPHEKVAYRLPDRVPYLDKNGNKRMMSTEEYIKAELQKEMAVRDSIAAALADTSDDGIIPQFKAAVEAMRGEEQHSLKGERDLRKEYERIRKEGEMAGKTEEEIETEITSVVWPQYQELVKTFGAIKRGERPVREIEVPQKSEEDRKVSQTVRTILEAEVTPESAIPTIEQMVTQGDFSYDVITDKAAMDAAKKYIRTNKYPTALANWLSEVRAGKVSKANTALGWELYNQAATSGDLDTAITILDEMVKHQRNAAQAVQASRILKKLSPDAQLYSAVKSVQKLEEDINEKRKPKKKGADKAAKEVGEAKKDAADAAKKAHKGVRGVRKGGGLAIDSNQAGEPFVFEYAQKVGEAVAKGLEAGQNRVEKERTFLQQITAELKRFAEEKMPKKEGKKALTAVDLLRSYVQNQGFFADAWQYAQEELREKYAGDSAFDEFLNTGIGVDANANPQNAIFMRALVKAAADSGEGKAVLRRQSALGFTGMANTIADNLIQQTGAKGEMADTIRDAAHAYVLSTLKEEGKADADIVASSVRAAMSDIGIKISDVVMSGTGDSAKQAIVDKLVGKYGIGLVEATNTAEVVAESFDKMCREFSQRRLEAMFKERKVTRKTIQEKFEQLARLGAFDIGSAYNQRAAERIFHEGVTLTIDEDLARKFLEAKTQEERDSIMADIYRDVGRQMPSTFVDKWNAWRYLSMLGNFRTHGRNLAGNAFFAPIVLAKDMTATGIEAAVNFVTRGKVGRTKAIPTAELLKAAWADYANVADEIMAGGKYSDTAVKNQHIEEGRRIFGRAEDARTGAGRLVSNTLGKGVEFARRKNSGALEVEDKWFARPHYAFALAQYCKANGVTADQLRRGKALGNARAYAIKEAQKATYRDTNALSETVSALGRYNGDNMVKKGLSVVVEGILPFRKTPANILARGIEYSPIGLVKSITWDLVRVKNGDITAAEMIDNLSSGLTGTGLLGLGAWLAAEGLIRGRGGDDEEEKEFEELQGHQAYSLELPDGASVTLDWLAPESLPFFVGVNLYEMTRDNKGDATLSDILTAVSNVTEPMLDMSCLQSLNDIFESVGYASSNDMDPLPAVLASAATSYLTQGVPTIFGQTERSTESVRMTTYPEKNAFLTTGIQRTLGKISAKTPGWDYQQIPYIDAWGRTESTGNPVANVANNFLNPAYTSQIETSAMEEELARLYDATGEASVFPSRADKYFTVDEERKDLTAQEYVKYATEKGQQSYKVVTALTKSDAYKSMTDFDRVEAVDLAYDYANAVAKTKVSKYAPEGWIAKAIATSKSTGLSIDRYIPLYMAQKDIKSLKDSDGNPISNSSGLQVMQLVYNAKGLTTEQRRALFDDFGVGKSIIHYNPALVNAKLEKMRKKK